MEKNEQNLTEEVKFLTKIKNYAPPINYKRIGVKISFLAKFKPADFDILPVISTTILGKDNMDTLHLTIKKIRDYINKQKGKEGWFPYEDVDVYNMENYPAPKGHFFHIDIWNQHDINLEIKDLKINFLGFE